MSLVEVSGFCHPSLDPISVFYYLFRFVRSISHTEPCLISLLSDIHYSSFSCCIFHQVLHMTLVKQMEMMETLEAMQHHHQSSSVRVSQSQTFIFIYAC